MEKDSPIIDWELGIRLAGNKRDLAEDLLALFISKLAEELNTIKSLHQSENYPELTQRVHKLHGASCYCGIPRIKRVLAQLETELKNNIMDSSPQIKLLELESEINLLLDYYSHHANSLSKKTVS